MNSVLELVGVDDSPYRLLVASKVLGNECIEGDLQAEMDKLCIGETEHAAHLDTAGALRNCVYFMDRIKACKEAVPQLVADVRAIEIRHAEAEPQSKKERIARHDEFVAAKQKLDAARQEIADGNQFYYTLRHIVDEKYFAEAYRVGADIEALIQQSEKISEAIKPEVKVEDIYVSAEGAHLGYATTKKVLLDETYWEREMQYADNDKQKQVAKRKHLAIVSGKRKLAEIQSQIETLRILHDELARRPIEVYQFKM